MSDGAAVREAIAPSARSVTPLLVVVGCGALAARFAVAAETSRPTVALVVLFCALLACAACLPVPTVVPARRPTPGTTTVVAIVGLAAFAGGRMIVGGHAPFALSGYAVATSTLAAIAEEAWFRRLCFGVLLPAGPGFAIAGSTLLFAVVHVAIYGWWVLPLDLAAGALFGWQRAVSGAWTASAVTHVIANLLVLL